MVRTQIQTRARKEMLPLPSEEDERRMYARTREILEQYGYHRYEISNYAKDGYACPPQHRLLETGRIIWGSGLERRL